MAKRQNIEDQIRDWLANNLNFLEDNLSLISKEYKLDNPDGTGGFIDILAEDPFGHFVVIEVKQDKAAERSGTNELLKYVNLIKKHYQVGDDKIRLIFVSTDWRELRVPYAELHQQTKLSLQAYEVEWDGTALTSKKKVAIIPPAKERIYSPIQKSVHYETQVEYESGLQIMLDELKEQGLEEYVVIGFKYEGENSHVIYPYALCVVLISQSLAYYEQLLQLNHAPETCSGIIELADELEYNELEKIGYYEGELLAYVSGDGTDARANDHLVESYISEGWELIEIKKSGMIAKDPRANQDALMRELRGLHKESDIKFMDVVHSDYRARYEAIRTWATNCLQNNPVWREHVIAILEKYRTETRPFTMGIQIYNPPSLMTQMYYMVHRQNIVGYMPMYRIVVIYDDQSQKSYWGKIEWNGNLSNDIYDVFLDLKKDKMTLIAEVHGGIYNERFMSLAGLAYGSVRIDNGRFWELEVIDGELIEEPRTNEGKVNLPDFMAMHQGVMLGLEGGFATYLIV